jgi:hypothetical protein
MGIKGRIRIRLIPQKYIVLMRKSLAKWKIQEDFIRSGSGFFHSDRILSSMGYSGVFLLYEPGRCRARQRR